MILSILVIWAMGNPIGAPPPSLTNIEIEGDATICERSWDQITQHMDNQFNSEYPIANFKSNKSFGHLCLGMGGNSSPPIPDIKPRVSPQQPR